MKTNAAPSAELTFPDIRYVLKLYITDSTPRSLRAIANVRKICEDNLEDLYDLEIMDITEHLARAVLDQVLAVPTLVKTSPLPVRRFIGDMSQTERILIGLGLPVTKKEALPAGTV